MNGGQAAVGERGNFLSRKERRGGEVQSMVKSPYIHVDCKRGRNYQVRYNFDVTKTAGCTRETEYKVRYLEVVL